MVQKSFQVNFLYDSSSLQRTVEGSEDFISLWKVTNSVRNNNIVAVGAFSSQWVILTNMLFGLVIAP